MIQMMIRLKNFGFTEEEAFKYGKFLTPVYMTLPEQRRKAFSNDEAIRATIFEWNGNYEPRPVKCSE